MVMKLDKDHMLFIEPTGPPSMEPVYDELTMKMIGAFFVATPGPAFRGFHHCTGDGCSAISSNRDYKLKSGQWTNSLCVHYLFLHRDEVPEEELEKVRNL